MKLITTHQNADLDGVASMVALAKLLGPVTLGLPAGMEPDTSTFWDTHKDHFPVLLNQAALLSLLAKEPLEALYVVDTADPQRLGPLAQYVSRFGSRQSWDTHPPADDDLPRVVMRQCGACTSHLVLELEKAGVVPSPYEAGLFLLGIHQDTGHFTFPSTSEVDHHAAMLCRKWQAPADWPGLFVPKGFTRRQLELLEKLAASAERIDEAGQSVVLLNLELSEFESNLSVLVEQLHEAEKWPAVVAVVSYGERAGVIARSGGAVDVDALLRPILGGGHPEAASGTLRQVTHSDACLLVKQLVVDHLGQRQTAEKLAARPVYSVAATATIAAVADELHRRHVNALPLTRGRGAKLKYVGVVSRQEVDGALRHGLGEHAVAEISSQQPEWVSPQTPVAQLRQRLMGAPRRLLLVGAPPSQAIGVLTRGLVLRADEMMTVPKSAKRPPGMQLVQGLMHRNLGHHWQLLKDLASLGDSLQMRLYLVGGVVRDVFLDVPVRDLDVMVEGHAPTLVRAAMEKLGGAAEVRDTFATATWTHNDVSIDFASARSEYYEKPAALPKIEHASLNQDLYRRDFTMNAMAIALNGAELGKVYDPYGGYTDLHEGVLRVLHGLSFHDDPTRAFRAARFAARFDFKLSSDTLGLMKAALRNKVFAELSLERLGAELELILEERDVVQAFRLLRSWGLLDCIVPKFQATRAFFEKLHDVQDAWLRLSYTDVRQADVLWIALASQVAPDLRKRLERMVPGDRLRKNHWCLSPEKVRAVLQALRQSRRLSRAANLIAPLDRVEQVFAYAVTSNEQARHLLQWWDKEGRLIKSVINGRTLLEQGFAPGPKMRLALSAAQAVAYDGGDNDAQLSAALMLR